MYETGSDPVYTLLPDQVNALGTNPVYTEEGPDTFLFSDQPGPKFFEIKICFQNSTIKVIIEKSRICMLLGNFIH